MNFELTDNTKKYLLAEARKNISNFLGIDFINKHSPDKPEDLEKRYGCFVTLHKHGRLRGCIGMMVGRKGLIHTIREMANAAAFEDNRFPPLTAGELSDMEIEITVLTPLLPVVPENVVVGRHGLYVEYMGRTGVLLPQVPVEQGWNREEFLNHTCLKAGLPENTWRNEKITLFCFDGLIFNERKLTMPDNDIY